MSDKKAPAAEATSDNPKESILAEYGVRSLSKPKTDRRKVTKESIAFCCSKSSLDERDINQCTQCVI